MEESNNYFIEAIIMAIYHHNTDEKLHPEAKTVSTKINQMYIMSCHR
jgi:hypothetical protein